MKRTLAMALTSGLNSITRRKKPDWASEVQRGAEACKAKAEEEFEPPVLDETRQLVALQRVWRITHPEGEVPSDRETLLAIIPSGLTEREERKWYWGALTNAARAYQVAVNTSWSKTELKEKCRREGVPHGLEAFEPSTQDSLLEVIKYLSD